MSLLEAWKTSQLCRGYPQSPSLWKEQRIKAKANTSAASKWYFTTVQSVSCVSLTASAVITGHCDCDQSTGKYRHNYRLRAIDLAIYRHFTDW